MTAPAAALPAHGIGVALVEQPWRVAGVGVPPAGGWAGVAPAPRTLDAAWTALWPALQRRARGRSAGARVACRTARELGARAVLALSFPLHPPGRPEKSRAAELTGTPFPALVVQRTRDPFGGPGEFPAGTRLVEVEGATHALALPDDAVALVAAWLTRQTA